MTWLGLGRQWIVWSIVFLVMGGWLILARLRNPSPTPELKGQKLAAELGCFACHGSGGLEGVSNPGSGDEDIPAWSGGTAMMYLKSDDDIREYILNGHLKDDKKHKEQSEGLLTMPAYRERLNDRELEQLTAYVKAVSRFYPELPEKAAEGMQIAANMGCLGCHGPSGRGGIQNPGSFKGIVPGWNGKDFRKTVRNKRELESWIKDGIPPRFRSNPAAMFFLERAVLKMPAYENRIPKTELEALMDYIFWVQAH